MPDNNYIVIPSLQGKISNSSPTRSLTPLPRIDSVSEEEDKKKEKFVVLKNFKPKQSVVNNRPVTNVNRTVEQERSAFWDSMPLWYKQAYNKSLGGLMHEIMTGKTYYDISNAPENLTRDVISGFLSFFASKEDIGMLVAGAGIGGAAVKASAKVGLTQAMKKRTATLLARKAEGYTAKKVAYKKAMGMIDDVVEKGGMQAAILGTHQGFFEGAMHARDDLIAGGFNLEEYEGLSSLGRWSKAFGKVIKSSQPTDFLKMGALGAIGGSAQALRWSGKLPKSLQGSAGLGLLSEGLAFGGAAPVLMEGRPPTFQDFVIGAGIVGAISVPGAIRGRYKRHRASKFVDELEGKEHYVDPIIQEKYKKGEITKIITRECWFRVVI